MLDGCVSNDRKLNLKRRTEIRRNNSDIFREKFIHGKSFIFFIQIFFIYIFINQLKNIHMLTC